MVEIFQTDSVDANAGNRLEVNAPYSYWNEQLFGGQGNTGSNINQEPENKDEFNKPILYLGAAIALYILFRK